MSEIPEVKISTDQIQYSTHQLSLGSSNQIYKIYFLYVKLWTTQIFYMICMYIVLAYHTVLLYILLVLWFFFFFFLNMDFGYNLRMNYITTLARIFTCTFSYYLHLYISTSDLPLILINCLLEDTQGQIRSFRRATIFLGQFYICPCPYNNIYERNYDNI